MIMSDTFIISIAGYKRIAVAFGLFILFSIAEWDLFRLLAFFAILFFVFIYRNPEREIPYLQKGAVLSPVDGKVIAINTLDNGFEVVVRSSLADCSILRSPILSKVKSYHIRHGARLSTDVRKSMLLNEKVEIDFEDSKNNVIHVEHILDNSIDDIMINLHPDYEINQGKRYGVMTKGKSIIRFPLSSRLSLHVGSHLKAGESLMGYIS